jgi:hypothetical protein
MPLPTIDPALPLDDVRARFRALGLLERATGTSFCYALPGGDERMLLILQSVGRGAQIYLYPEAFGRPAGAAQWFYALLEAKGFGMGSKLGPSISLAVDQPEQMEIFWAAFARLLDEAQPDDVAATSRSPARADRTPPR